MDMEIKQTALEVYEPRVMYDAKKYPLQEETSIILGVCFEVYNNLGRGFTETLYKEAIEYELSLKGVDFQREKKYPVEYKNIVLKKYYVADFVVFDKVILEVKAQRGIPEEHYGQVISYLKASKCKVGLLVNFSESSLRYKRIIL
jgi:GxxExxY protein